MSLQEIAYQLKPEERPSFLIDVLRGVYVQEVSVQVAFEVIGILTKKKVRRATQKQRRGMPSARHGQRGKRGTDSCLSGQDISIAG